MIPKIIHYCWFSNDKKPKSIRKCIDSWNRVMPEYEVRCWDGNSFDFDSVPFVKEAMKAKKYAFAADYVRLYALYTQGGIYLDSDVFVYQSFDPILDNSFFCGTEAYWANYELFFRMEAAIMGAEPQHPFIKECLDWYSDKHFTYNFSKAFPVMPEVISSIAQKWGYRRVNEYQSLDKGCTVFSTSLFTNALNSDFSNRESLLAIHQNAGSWIDYSNRGLFYRMCYGLGLMSLYRFVESTRKRLSSK